jgi:hypothetical protein
VTVTGSQTDAAPIRGIIDASPAKAPHMAGKPIPAIQKMIPNKMGIP